MQTLSEEAEGGGFILLALLAFLPCFLFFFTQNKGGDAFPWAPPPVMSLVLYHQNCGFLNAK